MKKLFTCVLLLFPLVLFAKAPGPPSHPVFINGKPIGNALVIRGQVVIALEDLAKAGGSSISLEPAFKLQGTTLNAVASTAHGDRITLATAKQSTQSLEASTAPAPAPKGGAAAGKVSLHDVQFTKTLDKSSPILMQRAFTVNRPGAISSNLLMENGRTFVPLSDVAKAFGGSWTAPAGGLAPGASIPLNFARNPNAILIGL